MTLLYRCTVAVVLFALALGARAAPDTGRPPRPFLGADQLQRTLFTARDGTPPGIYAIAQDREGYLWVGGSSGLYRFDGLHFRRMYQSQLRPGLITALFVDREGTLWIGQLTGELTSVQHGRVTPRNIVFASATIMAFSQRPDGTLWVGTSGGVATVGYGPSRLVPVTSDDRLGQPEVNLYATASDESFVIFSGKDAYRYAPDARGFEKLGADAAMAALVGLPPEARVTSPATVADMVVDPYGALWVPGHDGFVRMHVVQGTGGPQVATEQVRTAGGEPMEVTADFVAADGTVWVASTEGLEQFRATRFTPLSLPGPVRNATIISDSENRLWIASATSTPPMRVGGTVEVHPEFGPDITCLARSPDGSIWFAGKSGFYQQTSSGIVNLPPPVDNGKATASHSCHGLATGPNGDLWLNMYRKTWQWDGHAWRVALPLTPMSLVAVHDGTWIGRLKNTLVHLADGKETRFGPESGIDVGNVDALTEGSAGLWLGGADGLMLKHGDRFLRLVGEQGERFEGLADIAEAPDGDLWLVTLRGVFRIPAAAWKRAVTEPGYAVPYDHFDQDDGLRGAIGTLQLDPLEISGDGKIWVATERGVAWLDPARKPSPLPPPAVSIESLNGKPPGMSANDGGQLPEETRSIEVGYTAATLVTPGRIHFRYRLRGADDAWQEAGTDRVAHYANLSPGHYTFQVEASNAEGLWSGSPATLTFGIDPAFWQTWWFRTLCVLVLVLSGWLLYRAHLARVVATHEVRVRERERIARDLHDSLLQHFQAVLLHAYAATQRTEGAVKQKFEKVVEIAGDALVEGREKILGLRTANESLASLPADMARLAQLLGETHAMTLEVDVVGSPRMLRPCIADEVHAVVHELVANAFRHAHGTRLCVEVRYDPQALVVTVTDDGRGIDHAAVPAHGEARWGMAGMQERATQIGGTLTIADAAEGGTRATLRVPARLAYPFFGITRKRALPTR